MKLWISIISRKPNMRIQEAEQIVLARLIQIIDDPIFYDDMVDGLTAKERLKVDKMLQKYQTKWVARHTTLGGNEPEEEDDEQ